LALFTPFALAATIIYMVHNMLVKTNLFLVSGLAQRLNGTLSLKQMGGLAKLAPWLAALFLISALSLAGVPPLSGFWAKLTLVQSAVAVEEWIAVAVALGVGALTLFSMIKIWLAAFWKPSPEDSPIKEQTPYGPIYKQVIPVVGLTVIILVFGFAIGPIFEIAERAGEQLINPEGYVQAVLGGYR
jgi:multicomponent Na+:H+ antiporter subunit D